MRSLAHGRARVRAKVGAIELVAESLGRRSSRAVWCLTNPRVVLVILPLVVFEKLAKRCVGGFFDPFVAGPVQPARFEEIIDKLVARLEKLAMRCLFKPGRDVHFYKFVHLVFFSKSRHGCVAIVVCLGRDIEARCDLMQPSLLGLFAGRGRTGCLAAN